MIRKRNDIFADVKAKINMSEETKKVFARIRENAKEQGINFTEIREKYFKKQ
jgi:hypothetical protein